MSLSPGTRFARYEILSALGAGGMGEVYRARDTRLNRSVAIKILPDAFAADPDRVARFEREAQTLASLNHPHIAQIDGLEEPIGVGVYDLASRTTRKVADDPPLFVRWSSDNRHLLYFTAAGTQLVCVDSVTGRRTVAWGRLPLPAIDDFAVAPDGRTIYYGGARSEADIWIVDRP